MIGMDRRTGKPIAGTDHLIQSVDDILSTPIGSRLARRDYCSRVPELLGQPLNGATKIRVYAATALALQRQEPRLRLSRIAVEAGDAPGVARLVIVGRRSDVAPPHDALSLSLSIAASGA